MASRASRLKTPEFLLPPPPSSGTFMTAMEARTDWCGWDCCRYIPWRLLDHVPVPAVANCCPPPLFLGRLGTSWDALGTSWDAALGRLMTAELSAPLMPILLVSSPPFSSLCRKCCGSDSGLRLRDDSCVESRFRLVSCSCPARAIETTSGLDIGGCCGGGGREAANCEAAPLLGGGGG